MSMRENILREEMEFPKWFASYVEKDYGLLFYNENDKESHDSNHAILYPEKIDDFENVLKEITSFYLGKGLVPRIYQPYSSGYFNEHREVLEKLGYTVTMYGNNRFMLLTDENTLSDSQRLTIKRITEWDDRIANDIYIPNDEEYGVEVEKNSIKNADYYLFAGFLDNIIVSIVSFHISKYGCTRFDYIITAKDYRNKGYARDVISYAVDFCRKNNFPNCFQWPAHETSERISTAAGFRVQFEEEAGAAVYSII